MHVVALDIVLFLPLLNPLSFCELRNHGDNLFHFAAVMTSPSTTLQNNFILLKDKLALVVRREEKETAGGRAEFVLIVYF